MMHIKSYSDLTDHPNGDDIKKQLNRYIYDKGKGNKFCIFLPSFVFDTADFMGTYQKSGSLTVTAGLSRFSPFETQLLMMAIDSRTEAQRKSVSGKIRASNRATARFIAAELERFHNPNPSLITKIKGIFR